MRKCEGVETMPPRIEFTPNAQITRRGNTDYVSTSRGPKPVRVFNGATGEWRVTRIGKNWFGRAGMPRSEYVIMLPAKFYTFKLGQAEPVRHPGWYPIAILNANL